MEIVALAGGVGGAKLVHGLARVLPPEDLTIVVNTADDFEYLGLWISPDLDTICYTLANISNPKTGWGRDAESWTVREELSRFGTPDWFQLGDRDLALHIYRTYLKNTGMQLSEITKIITQRLGIQQTTLPMTDNVVQTTLFTKELGKIGFQEYFVQNHCEPTITKILFEGAETSKPSSTIIKKLANADAIIFCPSNPFVSIDPILNIPGISEQIRKKKVFAVSPIIGGKAVKGPAEKIFREFGIEPSVMAVAEHYSEFLTGLMIDHKDGKYKSQLEAWGIIPCVTDILINDAFDRERLARELILFIETSN